MGLERVANLEQLMQLEFGRGFLYNRPLRLNLLDLDYELVEQLVSFMSLHTNRSRYQIPCHLKITKTFFSCFTMNGRGTLWVGNSII